MNGALQLYPAPNPTVLPSSDIQFRFLLLGSAPEFAPFVHRVHRILHRLSYHDLLYNEMKPNERALLLSHSLPPFDEVVLKDCGFTIRINNESVKLL